MQGRRTITVGLSVTKIPESRPSIHCPNPLGRSDHVTIETILQEESVAQNNLEMGDRTMLRETLQRLINLMEKLTGKSYLKIK